MSQVGLHGGQKSSCSAEIGTSVSPWSEARAAAGEALTLLEAGAYTCLLSSST